MGALDDAIREHLELKRRHGASEDEISRAEAEALGPARRERTPEPGYDIGDPEDPVAEPLDEPVPMDDLGPLDEPAAPAGAYAAGEPPPPPPPPPPGEEVAPFPAAAEPEMQPFGDEEPVRESYVAAEEEPEPLEQDLAPEPEALAPEPLPPEPAAGGDTVAFDPLSEDIPDEEPHAEPPPPAPDPDRARTAILDDPLDELAPPPPARPVGDAPEPPADEDVLEETPDFLQETPEHDRLWFEQKPPRDFDFDD